MISLCEIRITQTKTVAIITNSKLLILVWESVMEPYPFYVDDIRLKHSILAWTVIILSWVPKSLVDFQMHLYTVCNSSNCRFNVSVAKFSTRNRDLKARQRTNKVGSHYIYYHWPFWNTFNIFLRIRFTLWPSCYKNECRKDTESIPLTPIFK